ncbi:hypothetical protein BN1723_007980 [Verticillium longisporum]|uniref:UFSP1/2/DUB catalytic domain-containing protein n=1 Tax=Verticillium longisporum TaxID=100787 RepID=A0A0G4NPC9_VERLO|nr:hypothetical protein BN1723_007980 [Verticillium longisporum]
MPDWLAALLRTKGEIKTEGVVPVLKQLLEQNNTTQYAYLCHESVQHISKLKLEGGFCGYRNIQMLISYIIATGFEGQEHFQGRLPTIFEIQDFIENAWDRGINVQGRVETGGIRGTRKYIGTAEAQALCKSLAIPCTAQAFSDKKAGESEARLLEAIETYFQMGASLGASKVVCTTLAPVYFQHAGKSTLIAVWGMV